MTQDTAIHTRDTLHAAARVSVEDTASVPTLVASVPWAPRAAAAEPPRAVPPVQGLTLRAAVHALHAAGFHVQLGGGPAGETIPAAGTVVPAHSVVKLGGAP